MRLQQLFSRDLSQVIGSHCGVRNAIATFTWRESYFGKSRQWHCAQGLVKPGQTAFPIL